MTSENGILYCFNTLASSNIYKCGMTTKTLSSRLSGYMGPAKPRIVIFSRKVSNVYEAEQIMLQLYRQTSCFRQRKDLGKEWFNSVDTFSDDDIKLQILNVINIVCMIFPFDNSKHKYLGDTETGTGENALPQKYMIHIERFITSRELSDFSSFDHLRELFESSEFCPYFTDFLPCDVPTRTKCIMDHFPHLSWR